MTLIHWAKRLSRRQTFLGYIFLLPAVVLALILFIYPIYLVTSISLHKIGVTVLNDLNRSAVTLQNYATMIAGSDLGATIGRSAAYTFGVSVPAFILGLLTALLFNMKFRGNRFLRTITLVPWAVPGVVAATAFLWMLDGSYGVINSFMHNLGLIPSYIPWLASPSTAMVGVIIPTIWTQFPFYTLMLLAALQNVPPTLYEAAKVDGASAFQRFFTVTWPGIRTTGLLAFLLGCLSAFREFDLIYSLTQGGPISSTETLAVRIYNEFFVYFHGGLAGAIAVFTMLLCAAMVWALYPFIKKEFF